MAKKKTPQHVHKYHLVDAHHNKLWACALPDCNHYMPKHLTAFIKGKRSICWSCGKEMILDETNMVDNQPICFNCKKPNISNKLHELFGDEDYSVKNGTEP